MVKIKICGITNNKEIEYVNILKPEYIGFVFTKSKRQISGDGARELCNNLNSKIKTVGVFKDNSISEILDVLKKKSLDIIQLHGKEDEAFIIKLKKNIDETVEIWKALSISDGKNISKYKNNSLIDNLLIDGDNPGSGEIYSLENIGELFGKKNDFFLAGGITPDNVLDRIIKAKPIGVDVSSGVEIVDKDGFRMKSFEKMKELIDKVRSINLKQI